MNAAHSATTLTTMATSQPASICER
jgi:hypothetical protein